MSRRMGAAVTVGRHELHSSEWWALRAERLGGSEIAAVVGMSPWVSPYELWHRKAGLLPEDRADSVDMRWGREMEPYIIGKFKAAHPELRVSRTGSWVRADRPWMLANPDAFASARGARPALVEAKTARNRWEWGHSGSDEIPPYYLMQCRWYLEVFGLHVCHVAVLFEQLRTVEYFRVEAAPEYQAELVKEGRRFLDSIAEFVPPPIDAMDRTYMAMRELHPQIQDYDAEIRPALAERYRLAVAGLKAADVEHALTRAEVAAMVGMGHRAVCAGRTVASRIPHPKGPPYLKPSPTLTTAAPFTTTTVTTGQEVCA